MHARRRLGRDLPRAPRLRRAGATGPVRLRRVGHSVLGGAVRAGRDRGPGLRHAGRRLRGRRLRGGDRRGLRSPRASRRRRRSPRRSAGRHGEGRRLLPRAGRASLLPGGEDRPFPGGLPRHPPMSRQPRIGYYVHHAGWGHASRAASIARELPGGASPPSPLPLSRLRAPGPVVSLPLDDDGILDAPPDLHFAPLHSSGLRKRMAIVAGWIDAQAPGLLVVDVSVEVAALARLCGVPVVYVRQSGRRDDPAHQLAYAWSSALLAAYPAWLEPAETPAWVLERSFHSGAVTRFDGLARPPLERRGKRLLAIGDRAARLAPGGARVAPSWKVVAASARPGPGAPNLTPGHPAAAA